MASTAADILLAQWLESADPAQTDGLLEQLIVEHAQPAILRVVRHKLIFQGRGEQQDVEDVAGEVLAELIARLQAIKDGTQPEKIGSFSGYAAVAAYHGCNEYLRRKYPNRHRLKNRLRYLLGHDHRFALWESGTADWLCGLRKWQYGRVEPAPSERLSQWKELLGDLPHGEDSIPPADIVVRVFDRLQGPVEFDRLVEVMAWLWGVEDPLTVPETDARNVRAAEPHAGEQVQWTEWLRELWNEILQLPRMQRVALLLNLRAGSSPAAPLLPMTGVASIPEIATALELTAEELASLWHALPMEDAAIAERLGLKRQQVINLRKSARERLVRRTGGLRRLS